MLRGEIRIVDLEPVRSGEANKRRPAVLVSNDGANTAAARLDRGVVTVIPMTSNVERIHPFQVLVRAGESVCRLTRRLRLSRCDPFPWSR